jgi:general secretion pathway protein G
MVNMKKGFTLIELLVVMTVLALLLTIALPHYFGRVDQAKEVALKESLAVMRDAIDKFYADRGQYPDRLEDLVEKRYIRSIPADPITESTTTWVLVPVPPGPAKGTVYDVKSGAEGNSGEGKAYGEL